VVFDSAIGTSHNNADAGLFEATLCPNVHYASPPEILSCCPCVYAPYGCANGPPSGGHSRLSLAPRQPQAAFGENARYDMCDNCGCA
jgi:hypothetical protein